MTTGNKLMALGWTAITGLVLALLGGAVLMTRFVRQHTLEVQVQQTVAASTERFRTQLDAQVQAQRRLEQEMADLQARLDRQATVELSTAQRWLLVEFRAGAEPTAGLNYVVADVTRQEARWELPAHDETLQQGSLEPSAHATLDLPLDRSDAEAGVLVQVNAWTHTTQDIQARTDTPNHLALLCSADGETAPQSVLLNAHFFHTKQDRAWAYSDKFAATTCLFALQGAARLKLEVDARNLSATLSKGGTLAILLRLGAALNLKPAGK